MTMKCGLCCTKIKNLGVVRGKDVILHDVNIHVHCGELTALIGPNGAGKSTLFRALLGEIPYRGEMNFVDNKGAHTGNPLIGYVPQSLDFDEGTPTSVFDFFSAAKSPYPVWLGNRKSIRANVQKALANVQGEHLIDKRLGNLSGGELQRVLLALALDPVPDLLLLDEPVSGVDQSGMDLFYTIVSNLRRDYDLSIILISHDLPLIAKYADRVIFLDKTVKCIGRPEDVFKDKYVMQAFGSLWMNREGDFGSGAAL